jgi:hypothetical protein
VGERTTFKELLLTERGAEVGEEDTLSDPVDEGGLAYRRVPGKDHLQQRIWTWGWNVI